jgi:hypothetical protein
MNVRNADSGIGFGWMMNLREHVVHNVVLDDAMEHVAADEAKVTVDGGGSALDESPILGLVMRGLLVGVVKIGDSNYNN